MHTMWNKVLICKLQNSKQYQAVQYQFQYYLIISILFNIIFQLEKMTMWYNKTEEK